MLQSYKLIVLSAFVLIAGFHTALQAQESANASSRQATVVKLWPGEPAGLPSVTNGEEVDTQKATDRLIAGKSVMKIANVSQPEMHVYLAEASNGATCVICPGGGFNILAWDLEGVEVAQWLNSIGVNAIVLKYRVPTMSHGKQGRYDGPVNDAQRALSTARANADRWKIDKDQVGILGFSAGGLTAAVVSIAGGTRNYEPMDAIDQQPCNADFAILAYPAYMVDDEGKLSSEFSISAKTPPTFLVHAQDDQVTCLSSVALFAALKAADVQSELHIFSTGGHGYGLRESEAAVTRWPLLAEQWMKAQKIID